MLNFIMSKAFAWLIIVLALAGGVYYYHFYTISQLKEKNEQLAATIKAKDITIHNLGVEMVRLIEDNKVTGFEEYFNGLSDTNTSYSADLLF